MEPKRRHESGAKRRRIFRRHRHHRFRRYINLQVIFKAGPNLFLLGFVKFCPLFLHMRNVDSGERVNRTLLYAALPCPIKDFDHFSVAQRHVWCNDEYAASIFVPAWLFDWPTGALTDITTGEWLSAASCPKILCFVARAPRASLRKPLLHLPGETALIIRCVTIARFRLNHRVTRALLL